jgi:hypothetical protein
MTTPKIKGHISGLRNTQREKIHVQLEWPTGRVGLACRRHMVFFTSTSEPVTCQTCLRVLYRLSL